MKFVRSTSTVVTLVFGLAMTSLAAEPRYSQEQSKAHEQLKLVVEKLAALPEPDPRGARPPQISAATLAAMTGDPAPMERRSLGQTFAKTYLFNAYMMAGEAKLKLGDAEASRAMFDKSMALGKDIYRTGNTNGSNFRPAIAAMIGAERYDLIDSLLALMPARGATPGQIQSEIQQVAVECMIEAGHLERAAELARRIPTGYYTGDNRRRALQLTAEAYADAGKPETAIELFVEQAQTRSAFEMPGSEMLRLVSQLIKLKAFSQIVQIAEKANSQPDAETDSLRTGIAQRLADAGQREDSERVRALIKDPSLKASVVAATATTPPTTSPAASSSPASSRPSATRPAGTQPVSNAKELDEAMRLKWTGNFKASIALLQSLPASTRRDADLAVIANQLVLNGQLEQAINALESLPMDAARSPGLRSLAVRAAQQKQWSLAARCVELADAASKRGMLERIAVIASSQKQRDLAKECVKQADALPAAEDPFAGAVELLDGDVPWNQPGLLARARVGDKKAVLESVAVEVGKLDPKRETFKSLAYELALIQALAGADLKDMVWIEKLPQDVAVHAWSGAGEGYLERISGVPAEVRRYNYRQAGFG